MPIVERVWQASLCYSRSTVTYVPTTSTMLDHNGDTEGGNSGGPVVDDESGKVIALHRGCSKVNVRSKEWINKAVALLFKGNDPEKFRQAIDFLSWGESKEGFQVRKGYEFSIGECAATCFSWD
ncbi:hypothetical protein K445DRAFT_131375 [Daldinia sp. EC12]|nr:hypothetical protein K445DRAFT_131375 [Daldinia sp. EC12]